MLCAALSPTLLQETDPVQAILSILMAREEDLEYNNIIAVYICTVTDSKHHIALSVQRREN